MSWRSRINREIQQEKAEPKMSFTILSKKIKGPAPVVVNNVVPMTQQQHSALSALVKPKQQWDKADLLKYINQLRVKGFREGAKVKTKYNKEGTIEGFDLDSDNLVFYTNTTPDIIKLDMGSHVVPEWLFYNEEELTLI